MDLLNSFSQKMSLLSMTSVHCKWHTEEILQRYCVDCSKFVCIECITCSDVHQGHSFKKIEDIIDSKRQELSKMVERTKTQTIPDIEHRLQRNSLLRQRVLVETKSREDEVRARALELKSVIDKVCDKLLSSISQLKAEHEDAFESAETSLSKSVSGLKKMVTYYEESLKKDDKEIIVRGCYQLETEIERLLPHVYVPSSGPPTLRIQAGADSIENLFGYLQDENEMSSDFVENGSSDENERGHKTNKRRPLSRKRNSAIKIKRVTRKVPSGRSKLKTCLSADIRSPSRISLENDQITVKFVTNINSNEVWVYEEDEQSDQHVIQRLQKDGSFGTQIKPRLYVSGMTLSERNTVLIIEERGSKIYEVDNECVKMWSDLSPLRTTGLSSLRSGYIGVSISDRYDCEVRSEATRAVILLDSNKNQVNKFEYDGNTSLRLFTLPTHLTQNRNLDVCVIDRLSNSNGRIVVVSDSGKLRFTYTGIRDSSAMDFDPLDIAVTGDGCILIVDRLNGIHQVTSEGTFARFLINEVQGLLNPRSITVDEERKAWIGCEKGVVVRVWTYLDPPYIPAVTLMPSAEMS